MGDMGVVAVVDVGRGGGGRLVDE